MELTYEEVELVYMISVYEKNGNMKILLPIDTWWDLPARLDQRESDITVKALIIT